MMLDVMKRKILWIIAVVLILCGLLSLTSCSDDDSPADKREMAYTGVPLVIFDTDIGSSTDDLFALEMLYRYQEERRCKLLGVVVDREGEDCAAVVDVMNTFFGHGDVPIGLEREGIKDPHVFVDYRHLHDLTDAGGQHMFATTLNDYSALPEGWRLYRQLLAAQPDHSVSICSVGFLTCLAHLLESLPDEYSPLTGVELVSRKVKCLYIMAGAFATPYEPEYNLVQGISFVQTFFHLWPKDVDIMFSPVEVGNGIHYPMQQVVEDLSWTDHHPIKYVYENIFDDEGGQKMWDPLTIIQAIEGDALFTLSERGNVSITPKAETVFTPSATGNCRYQLPGDAAWNTLMLEKIRKYNKMR